MNKFVLLRKTTKQQNNKTTNNNNIRKFIDFIVYSDRVRQSIKQSGIRWGFFTERGVLYNKFIKESIIRKRFIETFLYILICNTRLHFEYPFCHRSSK